MATIIYAMNFDINLLNVNDIRKGAQKATHHLNCTEVKKDVMSVIITLATRPNNANFHIH